MKKLLLLCALICLPLAAQDERQDDPSYPGTGIIREADIPWDDLSPLDLIFWEEYFFGENPLEIVEDADGTALDEEFFDEETFYEEIMEEEY